MGLINKNAASVAIISYIGAALGYLNKIILFPNYLSLDQVGLANVLIILSVMYAQFSVMGIPNITLKFFPFFYNQKNKHHSFLFWGSTLVFMGLLVTSLVFITCKPILINWYSTKSLLITEYFYYIMPIGITTAFYQFYESYLRSLKRTVVPSFYNEIVLRLLITLCISLFAFKVIEFHQFVILYVATHCSMILFIISYMAYIGEFHLFPREMKKIKRLGKPMFIFGIFALISVASNSIITNVDTLIVTAKLGLVNAGIYTTMFFIATIMLIPYRAISLVSGPHIAMLWKTKQIKAMEVLYKKATNVNLIIGCFLLLLLWMNIDNLFYFIPKKFAEGKYVFLFLAIGRLADMATGLNGIILVTSQKYKYDMLSTFFFVIVSIGLNLFLIPIWGMIGAALATAITALIYNSLRVWLIYKWFDISPFSSSLLKGVCLFIIGMGVAHFIPTLDNILLNTLLKTSLCTVLFILPVLWLKLSPDINSFSIAFFKKFLYRK